MGELLQEAGAYGERPQERGWDHGVWIPMLGLYPEADVPLPRISLSGQDPAAPDATGGHTGAAQEGAHHHQWPLTHNLRQWTPDGVWWRLARAFDEWPSDCWLGIGVVRLASAPGAQESVPTADHLMPLFVAMGASQPGRR